MKAATVVLAMLCHYNVVLSFAPTHAQSRCFRIPALSTAKGRTFKRDLTSSGPKMQSATGASSSLVDALVMPSPNVVVALPTICYTVPGSKRGWRDKNGQWFDENGPRKGPPPNYWRQSLDERAFKEDMDLVDAILREMSMENIKGRVPWKSGKHSVNRMVLGLWAPITRRDTVVANKPDQSAQSTIFVPYTVQILRTAGRKFGLQNHYGKFDAHLEKGENLTIAVEGDGIRFSGEVQASPHNEIVHVGVSGGFIPPLTFGGIQYLSSYLMIMRDSNGAYDIWLRV